MALHDPPVIDTFPIIKLQRTDNAVTNRQDIQAAIDYLAANYDGGEVRLGGGKNAQPWRVDRPVILRSSVGLRGCRPFRTILSTTSTFPSLINGVQPYRTNANHWETDSYTDGTAGTRYPIRTRNLARVAFVGTPWDVGPLPGWSALRQFTIDLGFCLHSNSLSTGFGLLGGMDYLNRPNPFYFRFASGHIRLQYMTASGVEAYLRILWQPTVGTSHRLTIQGDLDAGTLKAWVDGVSVTMDGGFPAGLVWPDKEDGTGWGLGAISPGVYGWGIINGSVHDTTYFGCKFSSEKAYADSNPEVVPGQIRLDGAPITDKNRYFDVTPKTIALLTLDENAPADRLVKWRTAAENRYGFGYFLQVGDSQLGATGENYLEDMWFGTSTPYGSAVQVGTSYEFQMNRCNVSGMHFGLQAIPTMVSYMMRVRDAAFLGGSIANYTCWGWTSDFARCRYPTYHRRVGLLYGTNHKERDFIVGNIPTGTVKSIWKILDLQQGGLNVFERGMIDFEGHPIQDAFFDVEAFTHSHEPSQLILRNMIFGVLLPSTTTVRVSRHVNDNRPGIVGRVTLENGVWDRSHQPGDGVVRTMATGNNGGWEVKMTGTQPKDQAGQIVPLLIDRDGETLEQGQTSEE